MIKTFRKRKEEFYEAVQFSGSNVKEIFDFVGAGVVYYNKNKDVGIVLGVSTGTIGPIYATNWLVDEDKEIKLYTNNGFKSRFELV